VELLGGVLSSNPIGASGMLRFLEVALQVRGEAGEHQVDGVRRALGQAYAAGRSSLPCGCSAQKNPEPCRSSDMMVG